MIVIPAVERNNFATVSSLAQRNSNCTYALGIHPIFVPQAKEALALINGTQFICGVGSVALEEALTIIKSIQAISALSLIALKGHPAAFDERI